MNTKLQRVTIALLAAASLSLGACGSKATPAPAAAPVAAESPVTEASAPALTKAPKAAGAAVAVKSTTSSLGQILVDPTGRTLYAFTNDVNAQSTCSGTCAEAWPPLVVDENWTVAPGLDSGIFSTSARPDGTLQLMAGKFPLYFFSGDAKPGDVNGQGSGDVWFVMTPTATTITAKPGATPTETTTSVTTAALSPTTTVYGKAPAPAPAAAPAAIASVADTPLGALIVDSKGRTLYAFTKDADGTSTCVDACAKAWPPFVVTGDIAVSAGLDKSQFTTIARADGSKQLKVGKWPLYYFAGDTAAGEFNGQGSGGVWFVLGKDAKLIKG